MCVPSVHAIVDRLCGNIRVFTDEIMHSTHSRATGVDTRPAASSNVYANSRNGIFRPPTIRVPMQPANGSLVLANPFTHARHGCPAT